MSNIEAFPTAQIEAFPTAQKPAPSKPWGWIGVDLDGTLAMYDQSKAFDPAHIGEPIEPMLRRVKAMLAQGCTVKIMTARAADLSNHAVIHAWLLKHGLPVLEVTDRKDYKMVSLWDDRAVNVASNIGITHMDRITLMTDGLNAIAQGLGVPVGKDINFHNTVIGIVCALTEIEASASGALDSLNYITGDRFKGGEGSQGHKDLCAGRLPLHRLVKALERFRKVEKTEEAGDVS